ncbi:phosphoenolpyruvate synthase [Candidatus Pacearchaeota archaeon]|nr:phosphoenolpyruvate synthase [Candidatus Pacearchaeota archaeon]
MQEVKEEIQKNPIPEKKENSKTSSNEKPDFVKWFSELNKDSGKYVGGKGANLAEIYNLKIAVPPGFVVTAQAYDYFIDKAGLANKISEILSKINYEDTKQLDESTKQIRELIENAKFPKEMQEEILESYSHLDVEEEDFRQSESVIDILKTSREPLFVAVRSSATAEDLPDASFAGQQDSFVNIKGNDNLMLHIKKCFASLYTSRATYYRNKKNFKHEDVSLAVIIQKMVDSVKSGVIFSKDPTHKKDNVIIEAVWGLGEGIVSGAITPDKHIVSQKLEIIDTKLANKKIAITRDAGGKKVTVKLREEKAQQQVLKEYEIKKLAETALKLEKHYQKPQDIEFAIEGEDIMIVQTRPITTIESRVEKGTELKGEAILSGLAASPGIGVGKVKIIEDLADLSKLVQGDVLVTGMTNPDMVVAMQKSAAIVTDEGGLTAHAAIVSREMGIPCIVGTQEATTKLKEGEIITVDGTNGKVYKGKVAEAKQKEVLPVTAQTKTEIKVMVDLPSFAERAFKSGLKKVGLTRMEGIIAESGKHPQYFLEQNKIQDYEEVIFKGIQGISKYFEELWIRTSDIRSDEFQNLEGAPKIKEANPMLGMHGIRYGLKNPEILKAELKALKRVAEQGKTIGLLLPQIISVDEVKKVKEFLKEIDFQKAKIGIMVETPAAVQIINDLCTEGIDFISFGTNDLTQYLLAVDRGNEQVQYIYNELNPAILYQLEFVIRVCKRNKVQTSICGQAGSKKEMVKFLVERGIDSISVNADVAKEISEYIVEIEKTQIKGTDKEPRQYELKKEEAQDSANIVASPKEPRQYQPEKKIIQDKNNTGNKMLVNKNNNLKSAENSTNSKSNLVEGSSEEFVKPQKVEEPIQETSKPIEPIPEPETTPIEQEKQEYEKNLENKEIKESPKEELKEETKEEPPTIPGIQNLSKEDVEKDIQAIEQEKQEYLKEHPEEKEKEGETEEKEEEEKEEEKLSEDNNQEKENKEEFDHEPEFKDEKEINKKEEDKTLDIF